MPTKNEQQKTVDKGTKPEFDHNRENANFDIDQHNTGDSENPEKAAYDKKREYSKS